MNVGRVGEMDGGRQGGREAGREGGRKGEKEGEEEGGREGGMEVESTCRSHHLSNSSFEHFCKLKLIK